MADLLWTSRNLPVSLGKPQEELGVSGSLSSKEAQLKERLLARLAQPEGPPEVWEGVLFDQMVGAISVLVVLLFTFTRFEFGFG